MSELIISKDVELYRKIALSDKRPKLKNMFKLLDLKPLPFQERVIDIVDNHYDEFHTLFFLAGRRSSKSTTSGMIAVLDLLIPQANVALVTPTNKQNEVIFNEVLKTLRKLKIKPVKINTQQKTFTLENGSNFYASSVKTVEQLEGLAFSKLNLDEIFLIPDVKRVLDSLSPAMATYGTHPNGMPLAKTIMLGSLRTNKEAYEYYLRGERGEKGYKSINFKATENPLFTKEMLEAERNKIGEKQFRMQYLNEPVLFEESSVFYAFKYNENTTSTEFIKSIIDKDSTLIAGIDIGATDSTAYLLIYVEKGKYYVIDGFLANNISEAKIAEKIKQIENKYGVEPKIRYIDPSAKLTRLGLASEHDIVCFPALNGIKEGINILNQLFEQHKLFINKDMQELITQIQTIEWKESGTKSADPFKKHKEHHFDYIAALRYAIFTHYKQNSGQEFVML